MHLLSAAPAFTSAASAAKVVGQAFTFTVSTRGTAPVAITSEDMPRWLTLTDNRNGTGTLAGKPPMAGVYPFRLAASNRSGTASQNFTLTAGSAPKIASESVVNLQVGKTQSFQVTATGFPAPTFAATGLPPWLGLSAGGRLTGTAPTSGTWYVTIAASNTFGTSRQQLTVKARR